MLKSWLRFNHSYKHFTKLYQEIRNTSEVGKYIVPLWKNKHENFETKLLARKNFSFLSDDDIRSTMFVDKGGQWMSAQLKILANQYPYLKLLKLLRENSVGNPNIKSLKYLTSHNSVHLLCHFAEFQTKTKVNIEKMNSVIEWGGGYGRMAAIYKRINLPATYTIIDLPIFSVLQSIYLAAVLGNQAVHLITKPKEKIIKGKINILPLTKIRGRKWNKNDLFISTWALSESTEYAQSMVEKQRYFGSNYLLIAHQSKNQQLAHAEKIQTHLKNFEIITQEKISYLPAKNYYLFARKKSKKNKNK